MDSERQRRQRRKVALIGAVGIVVAVAVGLWLTKLHREEVERAVRDARIAGESQAGPGDTATINARADEDDRRRELESRESQHLTDPTQYEALSKEDADELATLRQRQASRKKAE
jgi:hypothetical protein